MTQSVHDAESRYFWSKGDFTENSQNWLLLDSIKRVNSKDASAVKSWNACQKINYKYSFLQFKTKSKWFFLIIRQTQNQPQVHIGIDITSVYTS